VKKRRKVGLSWERRGAFRTIRENTTKGGGEKRIEWKEASEHYEKKKKKNWEFCVKMGGARKTEIEHRKGGLKRKKGARQTSKRRRKAEKQKWKALVLNKRRSHGEDLTGERSKGVKGFARKLQSSTEGRRREVLN